MKHFRVGVDARLLGFPGIGRYIRHLLSGLSERSDTQTVGFVNPEQVAQLPTGIIGRVLSQKPFAPSEQFALARHAREANLDVLHSPHFNSGAFASVARVVTIHDLAPIKFAETGLRPTLRAAYARLLIQTSLARAQMVLTDSEFIRDELLQRYRVRPEAVQSVPLAVDLQTAERLEDGSDDWRLPELPSRFFLYVGTNKPWKNLRMALRGAALASVSEPGMALVVAGKQARNQEPLGHLLKGYEGSVNITVLGTVSDGQLAHLYARTTALLCPSVYEGFGLTALEGMACGAPVLHSGAASLAEVVGSAGIRADPFNEGEWCRAMLLLWRDGDLRAKLRLAGQDRARQFTVSRMTDRTVEVYQRAMHVARTSRVSASQP